MTETHVISALVKRRSIIAGDIENAQETVRKLATDLEHVDATIRLFAPDYCIDGIKPNAFRPPDDWAKRGEVTRVILEMLRQANEPMTVRDVALALMTIRGLDKTDRKMVGKMTKRAGAALRHSRDKGVLRSSEGPGMFALWEVVR